MNWKYADELAREYTEDLQPWIDEHSALKRRKKEIDLIIKQRECQQRWDEVPLLKAERAETSKRMRDLGSVISSSRYSIAWLETAREPGRRREISRQSRYQRTYLWEDMDRQTMDHFREDNYEELSEDDLRRLDDYMINLTDRERDAVVSVVGKKNSYGEAADYLGITKGAAQTYVKRAMNKIYDNLNNGIQTSLF